MAAQQENFNHILSSVFGLIFYWTVISKSSQLRLQSIKSDLSI